MKKRRTMIPLVTVMVVVFLCELGCAQLDIPQMPGPPYPDSYGRNRWGVKYDPSVHGRGRSEDAPSMPNYWAGEVIDEPLPREYLRRGIVEDVPVPRSPRSRWGPGAKLDNSIENNRKKRRPKRPLQDIPSNNNNGYKTLYTSRKDRGPTRPMTEDFLRQYNQRPSAPARSTGNLASIRTFLDSPPERGNSGRRRNRVRGSPSRPIQITKRSDSDIDDDFGSSPSKGSLKSSYLSLLTTTGTNTGSTDLDTEDTKPQSDFFKPGPQIGKKTILTRTFAKTLSKLYNDYTPGGENENKYKNDIATEETKDKGSKSSKPSRLQDDEDLKNSFVDDDLIDIPPKRPQNSRPRPPRPPPSPRKKLYTGGGRRGPAYIGGGGGPNSFSSPPDYFIEDEYTTLSGGGPPYDSIEYSDLPPSMTFSSSSGSGPGFGGGFTSSSSSGPYRVSSYLSGPQPPHPPPFPPSFDDNFNLGPGPAPPVLAHAPPPPPPPPPPPATHPPPPPPPPLPLPAPIIPAVNPLLASAPLPISLPIASSPMLSSPTIVISPGSSASASSSSSSSKKKERIKETRIIPITKPKRKKPRFQHHPAVVLREIMTRSRNRHGPRRDRDPPYHIQQIIREPVDDEKEVRSHQQPTISLSYPQTQTLTMPSLALPQVAYNPLLNTLSAGGMNYLAAANSIYSHPPYHPPPPPTHPPPPPPTTSHTSPLQTFGTGLSSGILTLREALAVGINTPIRMPPRPFYRPRPPYYDDYPLPPPPRYRYPPPPPPPPPRDPPREHESSKSSSNNKLSSSASETDLVTSEDDIDAKKKDSNGGPITQHLQDWPRIFTAMGTSVDAVAGGIHAVRKEISKATGNTIAKGIMMSGSAVHEVTKGMASMITKMSSI